MLLSRLGVQEIVVILALALLIFGPGKLPGVAGSMGGKLKKAKDEIDEFNDDIKNI